ncbi:MAG: hypothetical protein ABSD86_24170, partial [Candidatus Sulfotelmatobacter sp.]
MRTLLRKTVAVPPCLPMLVLSLGVSQGARCYAQTQTQPNDQPKVAALHEPLPSDTSTTNSTAPANARSAAAPDPEISPAVAKQFAAMQAEIEQLKAELKGR